MSVSFATRPAVPRPVMPRLLLSVRSFQEIPRTCLCDWEVVFICRRVAGWGFVKAHPWCPHHGGRGAGR